jgi:hypothetical protein
MVVSSRGFGAERQAAVRADSWQSHRESGHGGRHGRRKSRAGIERRFESAGHPSHLVVDQRLWVPDTQPASRDLLIFVDETAEPVEAADAAGVCQVVFREAA